MKCGDILATEFDLDSAGTLETEPSNTLLLDVLYATALDGYSLSQVLDVPPERIHAIQSDGSRENIREATRHPTPLPHSEAAKPSRLASAVLRRCRRYAPQALLRHPVPSTPKRLRNRSRPHRRSQVETTVRLNVGSARFADDAGGRTGAGPESAERGGPQRR